MYFPDSFWDTKLFLSTDEFRKNFRKIPDTVEYLLDQMDEYVKTGYREDFCFLSFRTHKRSDVIKFLHENMGRVTYLDMSEGYSDPLRIFEELKTDYQKMVDAREMFLDYAKAQDF